MTAAGKTEVPVRKLLPGVKNIIAVASGKGGVGKSTVSANLALALERSGATVGLLDADVYGPSIPTILGITEQPAMTADNRVVPVERYGVKVISSGFFIPQHEAVIWRGPMLHKMIQDLLGVVDWGQLDYLIIDLPPGTGDVQLSLCQSIPLTGALIVSTPQDVAWNVAQKAIVMFDKLNAPILGIVENMSHHVCSHCGGRDEIFGTGGARRAAERLEIPFLGEIPLVTSVRRTADEGDPVVHSAPASIEAKTFVGIAERLVVQVGIRNSRGTVKPVPAKISPPSAEFFIEWSDGLKTVFVPRDLRLACPCAACVDEVSGQRTLRPEHVSQDVMALSVHPVGRYALQIMWSDGHSTGLYGFEYLRKLARS